MAINWSSIGSTISGITSALTSAGVNSSSIPNILASIGLASNPNQNDELTICSAILIGSANPALVSAYAIKLATEVGIPPAAASLAMTLGQPNVDIPTRVSQIEAIIKNGS